MECKELFIFENGQPLTTPPPQVSFWAFRLTVGCSLINTVRNKTRLPTPRGQGESLGGSWESRGKCKESNGVKEDGLGSRAQT